MSLLTCTTVLICSLFHSAYGFYVSLSPTYYKVGESIPIYFNKATSEHTQLPFAYDELPFVCSPGQYIPKLLNLGEVLRGDRIIESDIRVKILQDQSCANLCTKYISIPTVQIAQQMILDDYVIEWIIDDLPSATAKATADKDVIVKRFDYGFPLGFASEDERHVFMYNHLLLNFLYQKDPSRPDHIAIVGFEVYPKSIKYDGPEGCVPDPTEDNTSQLELEHEHSMQLSWTYSVRWEETKEITWYSRWDMYLGAVTSEVHWYSIVNSLVILLSLSALAGVITLRALKRDIAYYNSTEGSEQGELDDDGSYGWKSLHGDVFRSPMNKSLLTVLVGTGSQLFVTAAATTLLAVIGLLSPGYRGGIQSVAIFTFALCGIVAGFISQKLQSSFRGNGLTRNAIITASFVPGLVTIVVCVANTFLWYMGSSIAIPFRTFFVLAFIWLGVELPLVCVGSYLAIRSYVIPIPTKTHMIPRQIPDQPWYLHTFYSVLIAGAVPFAVIFLEMFFILDSVWQADHYYYFFGFLAMVGLLMILTIIEINIVSTYFTLAAENHKWHWKAFFVGASSAIYIFIYSLIYSYIYLDLDNFMAYAMFGCYSFVASFLFWLCSGAIGYLSSYIFVISIYTSIKVD